MSEPIKTMSNKAGMPPGTLVHLGVRLSDKVRISTIDYTERDFVEQEINQVNECLHFKDKDSVTWINIDGLHDIETMEEIGDKFNLHPLLLEDILNTRHRPKVEMYDDCVFLTLKMLGISPDKKTIVNEQVSFILGDRWLISFQEKPGDIFDALRIRMREGTGIIRQKKVDYLLYRLIDTVVDNYFFVTEHLSDVLEKLEARVLDYPDTENLQAIQKVKRQLIDLRKSVNPLREAVSLLQKEPTHLIKESTNRYLRDVYEHIIQANETIETYRDMVGSIMDLYLNGVSNKMNEVMQVLTIMSTIFIPLTFVAGIYGMNFDHMPELHWKYGYPAVWMFMGVLLVFMIYYFKKKKWF